MHKFEVTIRATVTKTYTVEAHSEDGAIEAASDLFTVVCDDVDENYDQQVLEVVEKKEN
jgi:hypothetical protein